LWRTLAEFFAKTLNDHHYEYRPWLYSRGTGFAHLAGGELYRVATARHAWLYRYLRGILVRHTELSELPTDEQDALLGNFLDGQHIEAIGAEAETLAEQAWRSYGQLRELSFLRNDGFPLPAVFPEFDPALIQHRERVNHVIAAPVGRTHFSRMLKEGPTLTRELAVEGRPGVNLIIGRKLDLLADPALPQPVACIRSGHFFLDADSYRAALARYKPGTPAIAHLHPKGIRVAARFSEQVQAALVYPFHGDPSYTSGALEEAGLPYTVQSRFHTWTTYDKAKYPDIFSGSDVELPAEIDWLATWSKINNPFQKPAVHGAEWSLPEGERLDAETVKNRIREGMPDTPYPGLTDFAKRHGVIIVKDAAESGGRNMRVFDLRDELGMVDESVLSEAVDFVYQISLKHNVAIQEVIQGSPEFWATETFMDDFVRRQIVEWGQAVDRRREPQTPIHGSFRVVVSTDDPQHPDPEKKWHCSHWITLNSRHTITNVGRGGTLDQLLPEFIQPQHRDAIMQRLGNAARAAAEALAAYEERASEDYARESGCAVGRDLMGISYGKPRYLMLDFLVAPVFADTGDLVSVRPTFDSEGNRIGSVFLLSRSGKIFPSRVVDWRVVLIEPNIGVGLWDRVALREEFHELALADAEHREPDWNRIGVNARIVLRDLSRAGEDYLAGLARLRGPVS
jgi:hypothetical protein